MLQDAEDSLEDPNIVIPEVAQKKRWRKGRYFKN